jgi:hypothetical protein
LLDRLAQLDPLVRRVELEILDPPDHRAFKEFKEFREKLDPLAHKEILAQLDQLEMLDQLEALDLRAIKETLDQLDPQVQILRLPDPLARLDQLVRKVARQLWLAQLVHKASKVFKAKLALLDRPDPRAHRETVLLDQLVRLVRKAMKLLDQQVRLVRLDRLAQIPQ